MREKIGGVTLDYTFYKGTDLYTDGAIEDVILDAFQSGKAEEMLNCSSQWPILYHVSPIRENILEWYPFDKSATVLEVGSGCGAITGILSDKTKSVTCIDLSKKRSIINATRNQNRDNIKIYVGNFQDIRLDEKFDYVTLIGVWEYAGLYVSGDEPYIQMLREIKSYLKPNGKILIAIENKVGMKYWNGAAEDHTSKLYSGMNDYIGDKNVRTFSRAEIEEILEIVGIDKYSFYYPMPDYKLPEYIYSDIELPKPGDVRCYRQDYNSARFYNFYDATAFDQVCRDKIFSYFANSYFVVCGSDKNDIVFAKYSRSRRKEYQIVTYIEQNELCPKNVVKKPLTEEAKAHVRLLKENEKKWKNTLPELVYLEGWQIGDEYRIPYLEGETLDTVLFCYRRNYKKLIEEVRKLIDKFLTPIKENMVSFKETEQFNIIFGNVDDIFIDSKSLQVTNVDLIFSNLKLVGDCLYNYDYEWVFEFPIPYEYVLWRAITQLYDKYAVYLRNEVSKKCFLILLGIDESKISAYEKMEYHFAKYVYGNKYIDQYRKEVITQTISIL